MGREPIQAKTGPGRMPEGKLGMIMHKADHAIYLAHNAVLRKAGATFPQAAAILFIYHNSGCNQKALEAHLETRGASVAVLLNSLAAKGLLLKSRATKDARHSVLTLTAKGERLAMKCRNAFEEIEAKLAVGLSDGELGMFKTLLARMVKNLTA